MHSSVVKLNIALLLYGVKQSTCDKLQRVQDEAARLINNSRLSVSDQTYLDLHWLKIKQRVVFKLLLLVHKYFIGNAASYFSELLLIKDSLKRLLYISFMNTAPGRKAFSSHMLPLGYGIDSLRMYAYKMILASSKL